MCPTATPAMSLISALPSFPHHTITISASQCHWDPWRGGACLAVKMLVFSWRLGCWLVVVLVTFTKLMGGQTFHLGFYRDMLLWLLCVSCEPQKIPANTSHIYLAGLNQDLGCVSSQHSSRDSSSLQQFYWQVHVTADFQPFPPSWAPHVEIWVFQTPIMHK